MRQDFLEALRAGDVDRVRTLLDRGAAPAIPTTSGQTALIRDAFERNG